MPLRGSHISVFGKTDLFLPYTHFLAMDNETPFLVQHLRFTNLEAQIVLLIIFGLTEKEMLRYLGGNEYDIRRTTEKLRTMLEVATCKQLGYRALQLGFSHMGTLNGQPVFTERERRMLRQIAPWVCITTVANN